MSVKVGVVKELKDNERRVGLTPAGAIEIIVKGGSVLVESNAGEEIGYSNDHYKSIGATIIESKEEVYNKSDIIIKVKEPQPVEVSMLQKGQVLFSYLHLAAEKELTQGLIESGSTCIAFETITNNLGALPLLSPMSEIAGKMSVQVGARLLESISGGKGILLGGVPGTKRSNVAIVGGGVSGKAAAEIAIGMGARVTIFDRSVERLRYLEDVFGSTVNLIYSSPALIEKELEQTDLLIGAVLIPGSSAPKIVTRAMIKKMPKNSVAIDIAIDQGGCFETSRGTSHTNPTYIEEGVVHYCVTNIPASVANTATSALQNFSLPFLLKMLKKGWKKALNDDHNFRNGLNIINGKVTHKSVADSLSLEFIDPIELI